MKKKGLSQVSNTNNRLKSLPFRSVRKTNKSQTKMTLLSCIQIKIPNSPLN